MDEIRCAVNRIDDECWFVAQAAGSGCFFAEEGVGGVEGFEGCGDHFFDCFVGFGDEVGGVLFGVDGGEGGVGGGDHGAGAEGEGVEGVVDVLEVGDWGSHGGGGWSGLDGGIGERELEVGELDSEQLEGTFWRGL